MDRYTHDGLTFDVTDRGPSGADEVVILLHGFPEDGTSWDGVAPALADAGYRVLAPDQRGYSPGARPAGRRSYRLELLVGDVLALADQAGAQRFHVVGHDWGGVVAWQLAIDHPTRIASLTVLSTPHPRAMARSMVTSAQLLRSWYVLAFQLPGLPEAGMRASGGSLFRRQLVASGLPEEKADRYVARMASGAATGALNWYRALPFNARRPSAMSDVTVPTLYVYSDGDVALGRRAADLTGSYVKAPYRYVVLEGVSHWIPEERPHDVARLALEHFASTVAA